ncbi:hypothetical protein [Lacisediminihabitans profunda]|uniref:Di-and tripeptidase n=1 Tax=Lacisediminihabitans profunda TaxID=2594790 RepID=A0A5C8USI8_9MICO|nr:hypothetical protein [Lacisediminihabitans profunda]TXN31282.1 hypothetical protein FVP33_06855 [Lacisediminihabitans profunda]
MTLPVGARQTAPVEAGIDRLLSVQRPLVIAHVRGIRQRHPGATPAEIVTILERHYLAAVTTGGAAVGASAVIPGVGFGISLALSGVETAGFLETSALFAQSVTEVHGIAVEDPERARTLVMTMMLGTAGSDLVKQLAGQAAGVGPSRGRFWGELVTKSLPQAAMGQVGDRVKRVFVKRFAATQGASIIGRAIPFGIGAVIGGTGNHMLGRKVVTSARDAFGPPPESFPLVLEPKVRPVRVQTARSRIALPRFGKTASEPKAPRARKTPRPPKP